MLGERANDVTVEVGSKGGTIPESFRIEPRGGKVAIVGRDAVGAMYGAYEFAERVQNEGAKAWTTAVAKQPYLPERGLNLFLTLPWDYAKNDTDYDPAALVDPKRWWFQNDDYWRTLLDQMARSRLNWLDIHGAWDISVTDAPNLYAYFIQSPTYPAVGVSAEIKAANMRRLNQVVAMAHARGIRVSLMAYQADLRIPQNKKPPYPSDEATIYDYTRDVVERMIREAPGLDAIGFRIGESGKSESFFRCYQEAVDRSGQDIPLITRSWITRRQQVLPLARASKDFTVEIKYNGEQWGTPYMVAGGRVPNWYSYAFEDYLSDAGAPEKNQKTWAGWPAEGGGTWPSEPYKIVWQVRANGTHRIFPIYDPESVRRTIRTMKIGTASGYTVEGLDAYYPKSPDYYLANPADRSCDWLHQRDALYWLTWGRLGYDPTSPDEVFDAEAKRSLGPDSEVLVDVWKTASKRIPSAFAAFSLGPDHRNHAPELEWGGDSEAYIRGQGFDTHVFSPINEEFANHVTGGLDARYSLWDHAVGSLEAQSALGKVEPFLKSGNPKVREIAHGIRGQTAMALYYVQRFKAAHGLAAIQSALGKSYRDDHVDEIAGAEYALRLLAEDGYYRPFTERLRMGTNTFSWKTELAHISAEAKRLEALPPVPAPIRFWAANMNGPTRGTLTWKAEGTNVVCRLVAPKADRAWLLVKPLPSSAYFHRVPMKRAGDGFEARFPRQRWGHEVAAEAYRGDEGARFPDPQTETPYLIVPPQAGPTPQIYNSFEAMAYLRPEAIDPQKYSKLLLGTRSWGFFGSFDRATKRKILEPVKRGMRLVILQQDFNRYKLDWLPRPLAFEAANLDVFDPAGALGLAKVEGPGMMWQRFRPSPGWEIFGNGGIARLKVGQGEVWVTTARLMQNMQYAASAKAFVKLLTLGGKAKPTVLIDSCSESAELASSCHPDLMNSHEIPFKTLGEVIADEQGMDSFTPIPGLPADDDVLGGKGGEIANRFLKGRVVELSKRPTPSTVADFEAERTRRRKELLRSLGLDPAPPKTPLNARVTGVLQRNGYRIEKVVFESRPKFYVTAHVYVPNTPPVARMPAIVNVNGHWAHKKDEDRIQLRAAFQALRGYVAIAIDSPGWSFEGTSLIERRAEGDHNDFKLVQGGTNATGYYVWDAIRAMDYLSTRPDVDMSRVGITGASGGGLATLYAFAADSRYRAAVPVVYMSSMELAPDNGCLCNHVPATSLIGDRFDVIAIEAPKPVLLMGAQNDGEFPPDAMRLTHKKMAESWRLFGKEGDVSVRIFPGGHDYSQPMREAMIGFFDRYVRGVGDGSPVPQPNIQVIDSEDRSLLVLDPPIAGERTMRDLSKEYLAQAPSDVSVATVFAVNGGVPARTDLKYREVPASGTKRAVTFESEPGLVTPGVLILPEGKPKRVRIVASDVGKASEIRNPEAGVATLYLDVLGTGELANAEMRYAVYAGRSIAFTGGWQIARAAEEMGRRYGVPVEVVGKGALASLAATYAGLMNHQIARVVGEGCLRDWASVFDDSVSYLAVQPRAHLCGSLAGLRSKVAQGEWHYR